MTKCSTAVTIVLALIAPVSGNSDEPVNKACGFRQKLSAVHSMMDIFDAKSHVMACAKTSGFHLLSAKFLPDDDQTAKMCNSTDCREIITAIENSDPPDCVLDFPGEKADLNFYALVSKVQAECGTLDNDAGSAAPVEEEGEEDEEEEEENEKRTRTKNIRK